MDRGAWWAAVHGVAKSQTRLSDFTFTFHFHALEKEMATHSSVLAWRIPGTGEPGGLPSMRLHRVEHNWSDLAAAAAHTGCSMTIAIVQLPSPVQLAETHGLQHASVPCPSLSPEVCWNSCPLSRWCGEGAGVTQWSYKPCHAGPPKTDKLWWKVLTKHDPLEEGTANHSSIFALRTPMAISHFYFDH